MVSDFPRALPAPVPLPGCCSSRSMGSAHVLAPGQFSVEVLLPSSPLAPRTSSHSGGFPHLPGRKKTCVVQKPAWSQAGQEDVGTHRTFLDQGFLLNPQPLTSADPHLENQLTEEQIHPPRPSPPSLCWSCHDNQSSPFMPKNTKETTTKTSTLSWKEMGLWRAWGPMPYPPSTAPARNEELGTGRWATLQWQQSWGGGKGCRGVLFAFLFHILPRSSHLSWQSLLSTHLVGLHSGMMGRGQRGWQGPRRPL